MYEFNEPVRTIELPGGELVANFLYQVTDDGRPVYEIRRLDAYNTYQGTFVLLAGGEFSEIHAYQPAEKDIAAFDHWLMGFNPLDCPLCTRSIRHGNGY